MSLPGESQHQSQERAALAVAHAENRCKPCAYFSKKEDGCRRGDDCEFCHLCGKDEAKQRKKIQQQQLRLAKKRASIEAGYPLTAGSQPGSTAEVTGHEALLPVKIAAPQWASDFVHVSAFSAGMSQPAGFQEQPAWVCHNMR
mmetsp:Transcript_8233/g.14605  ORF Transcript_8233/g.14605 Transcript_8233/m.14605 type:complete len:143 (+) Transcript_8233:38-466(+)